MTLPECVLALARWPQLEPFVVLALEMASTFPLTGRGLATKPPTAREVSRATLPERGMVQQTLPVLALSKRSPPQPPLSCAVPALRRGLLGPDSLCPPAPPLVSDSAVSSPC